jgi:hypothetical protein
MAASLAAPEPAVPAYRTLSLPRKRRQVLGAGLNRSESSHCLTRVESNGCLLGEPGDDSRRHVFRHCSLWPLNTGASPFR